MMTCKFNQNLWRHSFDSAVLRMLLVTNFDYKLLHNLLALNTNVFFEYVISAGLWFHSSVIH